MVLLSQAFGKKENKEIGIDGRVQFDVLQCLQATCHTALEHCTQHWSTAHSTGALHTALELCTQHWSTAHSTGAHMHSSTG